MKFKLRLVWYYNLRFAINYTSKFPTHLHSQGLSWDDTDCDTIFAGLGDLMCLQLLVLGFHHLVVTLQVHPELEAMDWLFRHGHLSVDYPSPSSHPLQSTQTHIHVHIYTHIYTDIQAGIKKHTCKHRHLLRTENDKTCYIRTHCKTGILQIKLHTDVVRNFSNCAKYLPVRTTKAK